MRNVCQRGAGTPTPIMGCITDIDWKSIVGTQATLVRTKKRDGSWVATPVTAVARDSVAIFLTDAASGKVKRLRNFSEVQVASSKFNGEQIGQLYAATARRLEGAEGEAGLRLIRAAHPVVLGVIVRLRYWIKRTDAAVFELSNLRPIT